MKNIVKFGEDVAGYPIPVLNAREIRAAAGLFFLAVFTSFLFAVLKVGAKQKKFAWIIGVALASVMFVHLVLVNAYGPITGIICLICMIFLFLESAFGICLGCKVYPMIYKEKAQFCPGEVCDPKERQDIQKTSLPQILIVFGFICGIVVLSAMLHGPFSKQPRALFAGSQDVQAK